MKTIIILIISFLISFNVSAYEIDKISFWLQAYSIHSAADDMNERHEPKGVCIDFICYLDFVNSFGNPGQTWFINYVGVDTKYVVVGARFGLIWGYEKHPLFYAMPYVGLGYKYLWAESTYFPSPAGDGEHLTITMIRLQVYNKKW